MKNELTIVKKSKIHGKGLFARKDIPLDVRIIEYIGEKIPKEEGDRRDKLQLELNKIDSKVGSSYIFELNDKYDIDGNTPENDAKFINHSCNPNAEYSYEEDNIWITSIRSIGKGEEITMNYGIWLDDQDFDFRNYPCRCGSANCIGYMVRKEDWDKLENIVDK